MSSSSAADKSMRRSHYTAATLPEVPSRVRVNTPTYSVYGYLTLSWLWIVGACAVIFGIVVLYLMQWLRYRLARERMSQLLMQQAPVLMFKDGDNEENETSPYDVLDMPLVDDGNDDELDTDGSMARISQRIPKRMASREWYLASRNRQQTLQRAAKMRLNQLAANAAHKTTTQAGTNPTGVDATTWTQWMHQNAQDAGTPPRVTATTATSSSFSKTTNHISDNADSTPAWHNPHALAQAFEYLPSPSPSSGSINSSIDTLTQHWSHILNADAISIEGGGKTVAPRQDRIAAAVRSRRRRRRPMALIEELPDDASVSTVPVAMSYDEDSWQDQVRAAERLLPASTLKSLIQKYRPATRKSGTTPNETANRAAEDDVDFMHVL